MIFNFKFHLESFEQYSLKDCYIEGGRINEDSVLEDSDQRYAHLNLFCINPEKLENEDKENVFECPFYKTVSRKPNIQG